MAASAGKSIGFARKVSLFPQRTAGPGGTVMVLKPTVRFSGKMPVQQAAVHVFAGQLLSRRQVLALKAVVSVLQ